MTRWGILKYMPTLTIPLVGLVSLTQGGGFSYFLLIYAFVLIPILELIIPPDPTNLSKEEEELRRKDRGYDILLYLMIPVQYLFLYLFLTEMSRPEPTLFERVGKTLAMGLGCGVLGINVAHELGHRHTWYEKLMSKLLLLTSLYMHFFIEHNRGHHRWVSTDRDPASARFGESVYAFWLRSMIFGYISAWRIENARVRKTGKWVFGPENEMVRFTLIQTAFVVFIFAYFGWMAGVCFLAAALFGALLLETVNYIEHYGLSRKKLGENHYDKVMPVHSWNSDHVVGRIMLFELTRHSDHHYHSGRKYQVLRHFDESPQLPTGYPGMMLLALIPPLFFAVMNPRIERLRLQNPALA
ncbi:MAG: alkane 1-monooxygenase [Bacteroidia bacterium]|nr:alkane 1-monooxygenase [Bacteroidia bacterium]